jgi:mRNA-degrading endonuclease RelE of RelBE toxin-antitoxin system
MVYADTKERAHNLIDRMAPGQVSAVVGLLEVMVDPVARSLANAPYDDEPVSEEETREIAAARNAFAHGESVSQEEVLAGFGLTPEDFERMGQTQLEPLGADQWRGRCQAPPEHRAAEFRLRVGNYRVRFHYHRNTIKVTGVKHRREAYR